MNTDDQDVRSHEDRNAAFRIVDANLNRVFEGLRTLEDIARFCNHAQSQKQYKFIRHRLAELTRGWETHELLLHRNAMSDVGREVKTKSEENRTGGLSDISHAAAQRVQQSLRSLEELAKYLYPLDAAAIESLRYRIYDLNSAFLLSQIRDHDFLATSRLYVLADCQLPLKIFQQRIREISQAGVSLVQIRDKQCDAADLIRYTQSAIEAVLEKHTRIIVNDRADVAACTGAWGLHVGQTDISVPIARTFLSPNRIIGLSTHSVEQIRDAVELNVDCIGCGPVFSSVTKSFPEFAGLHFLEQAASQLTELVNPLPAFAIGGISPENVQQVIDAGFYRIAVSSSVWNAKNPAKAAETFYAILNG